MSILSAVLEIVSDNLLLIAIINFVNILYNSKKISLNTYKKRIITAIFISSIISIIFIQNFFKQIILLKLLLVFINLFKYILLTVYVYKKFNAKLIIISFIIQFICSNTTSALLVLISLFDTKNLYILDVILHLLVRLTVLFTALYINSKDNYNSIKNLISIIPSYTFVLIIFSLNLSDALIQMTSFSTSKITAKISTIKIFASLITIFMTVILLTLLFNVISKKYQSDINTALEKQIATQLYHYEQLEKMNIEIRRFRHDYVNHMKCISSMALNHECSDILNYLDKLSASFPTSSFLFETGNYIADAILTEKQVNSPDNILIEFDGVIPTDIDNTDLCIILSNAIDNAVEACRLCSGDKIINVYSGFKHGYFVFKIKNPTVNINADGRITTTKSDKINHGFGLANIKRTVKKYDGHVSTSCENNIFILDITVPTGSDNYSAS